MYLLIHKRRATKKINKRVRPKELLDCAISALLLLGVAKATPSSARLELTQSKSFALLPYLFRGVTRANGGCLDIKER